MICSVFANFATLYTKYQLEFWKIVCLGFENSILFTEINKQIDGNLRRDKVAGL